MEQLELSYTPGGNVSATMTLEKSLAVSLASKCIPFRSQGNYPRDMKACVHTETYTLMFRAAFFCNDLKLEITQMSINR